MIQSIVLAVLLGVSVTACSSNGPPMPTGDWHQLNVSKWQMNENDLRQSAFR